MTLAEKQQTLIDDLNSIHDVHERLSAAIARSSTMRLDAAQKTESNLVPGCVSRVWMHSVLLHGRMRFACDAESPLVKGLAALLCALYDDSPPAEIIAVEPTLWEECGFTKLLSPTRLNGLAGLRKRIREAAERFSAEEIAAKEQHLRSAAD